MHAGTEERRARVAQIVFDRAGRNADDDESFKEVLVTVSALYRAAYAPPRPAGAGGGAASSDGQNTGKITKQELLMRMALPWLLAPRHLAALISHGKKEFASATTSQ